MGEAENTVINTLAFFVSIETLLWFLGLLLNLNLFAADMSCYSDLVGLLSLGYGRFHAAYSITLF